MLRLSSDASRAISGLAGGSDGRIISIFNVGANNLLLKNESALSAAANRFGFGADIALSAKQAAALWYDATDARWRLLAGPSAAGGAGGSSGGGVSGVLAFVSATQIKFAPKNGDKVKVNGAWADIPAAGVTAANAGADVLQTPYNDTAVTTARSIICVDGVATQIGGALAYAAAANASIAGNSAASALLSEGKHYCTLGVMVSGGTGTWQYIAGQTGYLKVLVRI